MFHIVNVLNTQEETLYIPFDTTWEDMCIEAGLSVYEKPKVSWDESMAIRAESMQDFIDTAIRRNVSEIYMVSIANQYVGYQKSYYACGEEALYYYSVERSLGRNPEDVWLFKIRSINSTGVVVDKDVDAIRGQSIFFSVLLYAMFLLVILRVYEKELHL